MPLIASFAVIVALAASSAAPTAEVRVVRFAAEGLSATELDAAKARVSEELLLMGAQSSFSDGIDADCIADPICRSTLGEGVVGLLDVQLFRVGPILQVKVSLFAADGESVTTVERAVNAEGMAQAASLLGPELAPHVRALQEAAAPSATATDAEKSESATGQTESTAARPSDNGLAWIVAGGGAVVLGLGAIVALTASGIAIWQTSIAYTASAPGEAKGVALVVAPLAAGAIGVGAVLILVGGGVTFSGLLLE